MKMVFTKKEGEIYQKISPKEIMEVVHLTLKGMDNFENPTKSILASATETRVKQIEEEAKYVARMQGRNFVTKKDFMLASRILGIIK